jgi:hypothetical protein
VSTINNVGSLLLSPRIASILAKALDNDASDAMVFVALGCMHGGLTVKHVK